MKVYFYPIAHLDMDQMTLLCLVAETSEIVPLGGQKLKRQTGPS